MNQETAVNVAVGCVVASEIDSKKKHDVIRMLRKLEREFERLRAKVTELEDARGDYFDQETDER